MRLRTNGGQHRYRTKIEVFRDFLRAVQEPAPKTRIIGSANLNPASFQKYLRFCSEYDLVMATSGGFVVTPRAAPILAAIEEVIAKTFDLEQAVDLLERTVREHNAPNGDGGKALRFVSRMAWNEMALGSMDASRGRNGPEVLLIASDGGDRPSSRSRRELSRVDPAGIEVRTTRRRGPSSPLEVASEPRPEVPRSRSGG